MKKLFSFICALTLALAANAETVKLADVIKANLDACKTEICPVFLDPATTYELDSQINLGDKGVWIWGGGATVVVSAEGQITVGDAIFMMRNAKFNCSAATKAIFGMEPNPAGEPNLINGTANQKVYLCDHKLSIEKCMFSDLRQPLFVDNGKEWAINTFELYNNVIQISAGIDNGNIINFSSPRAAIKHIVLTDNVIYNTSADITKGRFLRYGNGSNTQPQKIWGTVEGEKIPCDFTMTNNTIAFYGKEFANNFPNTNVVKLNWKKNIFINCRRLQKIGSNCTREFEPADNTLYWNIESEAADATDLSKFAAAEDLALAVPTTVLDLEANNLLSAALPFKPAFASNATAMQHGVSANVLPFKSGIAKTEGQAYEVVLSPDFLRDATKAGKATLAIDNEAYPWVSYYNSTSMNDDGSYQVSAKNSLWANIDPVTGDSIVMKVTGLNGRKDTPTLTENAANNWHKSLTFFVKDIAELKAYVTGASNSGYGTLVLTAEGTDGKTFTAESDSIKKKGGISSFATLALDPAVAYQVTAVTRGVDLQFEALNLATDSIAFPICHAPADTLKAPGTCYEVVLGPDMLTEGKKNEVDKPCINSEAYPWIVYNNPTSKLDNGASEVQKSNRRTDLNPVTGEKGTFIQVTGKNGKVDSPVCVPAWNKDITFGIKETTKLVIYATGQASGSAKDGNAIKATVVTNTGATAEYTSEPGGIYGKGTASDLLEITLDPAQKYAITVAGLVKDIQILGLNIYGTDLTVAPADDAPAIGDATGINNVNAETQQSAEMYNVAGQRVNASAKGLVIKNGKKFILR